MLFIIVSLYTSKNSNYGYKEKQNVFAEIYYLFSWISLFTYVYVFVVFHFCQSFLKLGSVLTGILIPTKITYIEDNPNNYYH